MGKSRRTANLVSLNNIFSDKDNSKVGLGSTQPTSKLNVSGDAIVSGVMTATGGYNLGINSGGTSITGGPLTKLNF